MPHKCPEARKKYAREYIARRRAYEPKKTFEERYAKTFRGRSEIEQWAKDRITAKKSESKVRGYVVDLNPEDLIEVYPPDGLCPIFRTPMPLRAPLGNKEAASIDRINPNMGYVKGNVRIISRQANVIKSNCSNPEVFMRIAQYISEGMK